ncbi:hypothetical protein ACQP2T_61305 [Nonomuraea sp. CA-143628]
MTHDGFRLDQWLSNARCRGITSEQRATLDALDPNWSQPQTQRWRGRSPG